jgi:hypothetical protein
MRTDGYLAIEAGRRYAAAADPQRFPLGMTQRAIHAAFRAYVADHPEISGQREQFLMAARQCHAPEGKDT